MKKFLPLLLCVICLFAGCHKRTDFIDHSISAYESAYTEQEHLERIGARTEEVFAEEIEKGEIVDYKVETVYTFVENKPQYFLVEIEYATEWNGKYENRRYSEQTKGEEEKYIAYTTKYKHLIGFIEKDIYRVGLMGYDLTDGETSVKDCFLDGRSGYTLYNQPYEKKYYGCGLQGVLVNGEVVTVANYLDCAEWQGIYSGVEFHSHYSEDCEIGKIVPHNLYQHYEDGEQVYTAIEY